VITCRRSIPTSTPATALRDKINSRRNGALAIGGTRAAEISDGLSSTIAIAEDNPRNFETILPYTMSKYPDTACAHQLRGRLHSQQAAGAECGGPSPIKAMASRGQ